MQYTGEILALSVAISWTVTALFAEVASKRLGALNLNIIRMGLSLVLLAILLLGFTGSPYPLSASMQAWMFLALSGLVGYVFGDYCLFNSYIVFGSKMGQLFMTLAPPIAGIASWMMLSESMSWKSWLAMTVTLTGLAISILAKDGEKHTFKVKIPVKGIILGLGAALGQGVGLVLSKRGLECYANSLPPDAPQSMMTMLPFAGTYIRAIFGLAGFLVMALCSRTMGRLSLAVRDRKGMGFALGTTFFGPFIGVSLSLMAVQYANAGIASTLMALTPVFIIIPYSLIYKQKVTFKELVGTIVTFSGVAMFFLL